MKIDDGLVHAHAPIAALAGERTFYLAVLGADGNPRCEDWSLTPGLRIDADAPVNGTLAHDGTTLPYSASGDDFDACGVGGTAVPDGDDVVIDGARWFGDEASCKRALARHQRVAVDLRACTSRVRDDATTQEAFEDIVDQGGTLYPTPACAPLKLMATGYGFGSIGKLWFEYGGSMLLVRDPNDPINTSERVLEFDRDRVRIAGEDHFFSQAACRAAAAVDARAGSWRPR